MKFTSPISIKKRATPLFSLILVLLIMPISLAAQSSKIEDEQHFMTTKTNLQAAIKSHHKQKIIKAKYNMEVFINNNNDEMEKLAYYYMAYADYRLFISLPDIPQKAKARYVDEAISDLKKAIAIDALFAEGQALLSSMYGMKISNGASGRVYGPKSDAAMQRALKNGPDNPRVHLLHGIGLSYSPTQYGGGAQRAIEQFKKSAQLFATPTPNNKLMPGWGHAEVYAWLGQAYEKNGQLSKAKVAYKKALDINPNYGWVKDTLLPKLNRKMEN